GIDQALQQILHHDLRAFAVERADKGKRQDALPEANDRRRKFRQLFLLALDHLFSPLLENVCRIEGELIDEPGQSPNFASKYSRIADRFPQSLEYRLLERE